MNKGKGYKELYSKSVNLKCRTGKLTVFLHEVESLIAKEIEFC